MNQQAIWLITGISSGLGQALAESVMGSGDIVVGTLRNQEQVDRFNSDNAGRGRAVLLDVTEEAAVKKTVRELADEYGRIDVLVNNAGIGFTGAVEESSMDEIRKIFEINFFATLNLTQAVLPHMRNAKRGHIVQISSHSGVKAFAGFGIYSSSKFALEGYSEALALEVAPLGIRVSIVEPGPFRTNFAGKGLLMAKKRIADYNETAGVFREKLKGVHGKQEGDPLKAALAIKKLVSSQHPTLRMPLGKTALATLKSKIESLTSDRETHTTTAENAVFS